LVGEAALQNAVPGNLTHVAGGELPHLGRNAVLLHQRFLAKVIVCRQRHVKATVEEIGQWVAVVVEKQRVVAQRGHRDADLRKVEQVLQHRYLSERR
ncbi:hypothetical protein EGW08_016514, partial [Elysia chlorotica]